jgi:thymidylate synthase ThyX
MYKCEIIADSLCPKGNRLTTYKVTYPRIIHAEMLRHRMLSRNVASSRAIPFNKMVKMVEENPFIPIAWQKDHKGMQGGEYFTNVDDIKEREMYWLTARSSAINMAQKLNNHNTTKQLCNRLLEPFIWTTELITGTEWDNFFDLRCPKYVIEGINNNHPFNSKKDLLKTAYRLPALKAKVDDYTDLDWLKINKSQAEIHIQKVAEMMWDAYNKSTPNKLKVGEWHTPYGDNIEVSYLLDSAYNTITKHKKEYSPSTHELQSKVSSIAIKIATARCARISYETLGDDPKIDYEADIKLHDRLVESKHWSPFEHCAKVMTDYEYDIKFSHHVNGVAEDGRCRNFKGFIQYRHLIEKI